MESATGRQRLRAVLPSQEQQPAHTRATSACLGGVGVGGAVTVAAVVRLVEVEGDEGRPRGAIPGAPGPGGGQEGRIRHQIPRHSLGQCSGMFINVKHRVKKYNTDRDEEAVRHGHWVVVGSV